MEVIYMTVSDMAVDDVAVKKMAWSKLTFAEIGRKTWDCNNELTLVFLK